MRIFISGGCKNGKSSYAEQLAYEQSKPNSFDTIPLIYIATMKPVDQEDKARIKRHIASRSHLPFTTIEIPHNIAQSMEKQEQNASYLLDSTTALLANEMFSPDGSVNFEAGDEISQQLEQVLSKFPNMVIVSDYLYSDAMNYDHFTEAYRKNLAQIDKTCAKCCDIVIEVCYHNNIFHKGETLL